MRATVFTDQALVKHAGRFAWLSIDVENEKNAAFLEKFPWEAVPTFLVLDPKSERAVYKWMGTADLQQLLQRFSEAEVALRETGGAAEKALAQALRLSGERKNKAAAVAYQAALQAAAPDWPSRPRTVEALILALQLDGQAEACARESMTLTATLPTGASFANAAATGLSCAMELPIENPLRAKAVAGLEPLVKKSLEFEGLLADDRSGIYQTLAEAAGDRGDKEGEKTLNRAWLGFIETERAKAPTVEARTAFDSALVNASMAVGEPIRALAPLEEMERALPDDYNPPARLAIILKELGRYDDALAANSRALGKAYGPRKLSIFDVRAGILEKKGDRAAAQKTLEKALEFAKTIPPAQKSKRLIKLLTQHLEEVKKPQAAK